MINIGHQQIHCPHFMSGGEEMVKSVIVGPLRLFETVRNKEEKVYDIVIGCSMFYDCENRNCSYSRATRMIRKSENQE